MAAAVPKAAVNEDGELSAWKRDVDLTAYARERPRVQAVPETECVEAGTEDQLRLRFLNPLCLQAFSNYW